MTFQKTPLDQQLAQLRSGHPAHPEFNASAVRSMADTPIITYLHDYTAECARLMSLLDIPPEQEARLTYQEAAVCIAKLWERSEKKQAADEAIGILALPILNCYERRKIAYGSSTENSAE